MTKDANYHEAAVQYNQELADFSAGLSERIDHPEIAKWCRSISKQHIFHARKHGRVLERLQKKAAESVEVAPEVPVEAPVEVVAAEEIVEVNA